MEDFGEHILTGRFTTHPWAILKTHHDFVDVILNSTLRRLPAWSMGHWLAAFSFCFEEGPGGGNEPLERRHQRHLGSFGSLQIAPRRIAMGRLSSLPRAIPVTQSDYLTTRRHVPCSYLPPCPGLGSSARRVNLISTSEVSPPGAQDRGLCSDRWMIPCYCLGVGQHQPTIEPRQQDRHRFGLTHRAPSVVVKRSHSVLDLVEQPDRLPKQRSFRRGEDHAKGGRTSSSQPSRPPDRGIAAGPLAGVA